MNFFEKELRKLFKDEYPDATFVGRNCYVPLGDSVRACVSFKTSGYADHYDTLHVKVLDRKDGPIDNITIRLAELLGKKQSPSPYLKDGVRPHIWVDNGKAEWYGFTLLLPTMRRCEKKSPITSRSFESRRSRKARNWLYICSAPEWATHSHSNSKKTRRKVPFSVNCCFRP